MISVFSSRRRVTSPPSACHCLTPPLSGKLNTVGICEFCVSGHTGLCNKEAKWCSGLCKSTEKAGFSFCQVKAEEGKFIVLSTAFKETTTVAKIDFRDHFLKVLIEVL